MFTIGSADDGEDDDGGVAALFDETGGLGVTVDPATFATFVVRAALGGWVPATPVPDCRGEPLITTATHAPAMAAITPADARMSA